MSSTLRIALDWTPNTNHTPLYVLSAQSSSLSLQFLSPEDDNYTLPPAKRVLSGKADIALCPSESILAHQQPGKSQLVAVAALLGKDASAIVALSSSGIRHPGDLKGKTYASYDAKYEDRLVSALIGGEMKVDKPARLDIWRNLTEGKVDFAWVFMPWEGLQAKKAGLELQAFKLGDYGLEYGYSPVLAVERSWLESSDNQGKLRSFLTGVKDAVGYTIDHPAEAADILRKANPGAPDLGDKEFVRESQEEVNGYYEGKGGEWGKMERGTWEGFVKTLKKVDEGFKGEVDVRTLYTNDYLE